MRYSIAFFAALCCLVLAGAADAQVKVHVNLNIGNQPVWGPTGYDYVEYYYLPDIEAYYDVPHQRYYYFERGRWRNSPSLPPRYRDYDAFHSYKVVVNERNPWRHHEVYRDKYASFKGRHDQEVIRDSRDSRYFVNKNHPEHNRWVQEQKQGRGHPENNGKGKGKHGNR